VEEEAKRVEVERLLEKAPSYIVEVARMRGSTMTPEVIKKLLELPEEKQKVAVDRIVSLRLTEDEAIDQIEAMKT
jgi:hypothetical protein